MERPFNKHPSLLSLGHGNYYSLLRLLQHKDVVPSNLSLATLGTQQSFPQCLLAILGA